MSDTGHPEQTSICPNCGGQRYLGLTHSCTTAGRTNSSWQGVGLPSTEQRLPCGHLRAEWVAQPDTPDTPPDKTETCGYCAGCEREKRLVEAAVAKEIEQERKACEYIASRGVLKVKKVGNVTESYLSTDRFDIVQAIRARGEGKV